MSGVLASCGVQYVPRRPFLICVDSDGCVFDTMGIKQRECFCPWMIQAFGLQPVALAARQCKEFADLFSPTRGANRHVTLTRILAELLPSHPEVRTRGFRVPRYPAYFSWVSDPSSDLSDSGLKRAILDAATAKDGDEFRTVLAWSERVNWAISEIVKGIPPFPGAQEALAVLADRADLVVVSATPKAALEREWQEHGIADLARLICGQEMGTKAAQIERIKATYACSHILVVGDALGDLRAAQMNGVLFYPIVPGDEEASWRRLSCEALGRFFDGTYSGQYEDGLLSRLKRALPEVPPWEVEQ